MCINRLRSRIELKHILVCKWRTRGKHHADIWLIQMNYRILWYLNVCETWRTPCSVVFNHKKIYSTRLVPDWRTWLHRSIDLKIEIFLIRLTGIFLSRPISYLSINISWNFQVSSYTRLLSTTRCMWLTEWSKSYFQHGGGYRKTRGLGLTSPLIPKVCFRFPSSPVLRNKIFEKS